MTVAGWTGGVSTISAGCGAVAVGVEGIGVVGEAAFDSCRNKFAGLIR